jgi:hypothetical protein
VVISHQPPTILTAISRPSRNQKLNSKLLYDWQFSTNQFTLATSPLRLTTSNFFRLNTCGHSPYVTSSLTRGWVCSLQLLLAVGGAVILRSESRRTRDHILLSRYETPPNLKGQVDVFISPRNRVAQLYPQALGSFSVAPFDTQGYGGGIRTRLHTGLVIKLTSKSHCDWRSVSKSWCELMTSS